MNITMGELINMVDVEWVKKDSAFTLLSKLGYTYDLDNGWDKEEPASEDVPEWMDGFEDLVYVEPKDEWDHLVLSKLSDEQKVFMMNMLEIDEGLLTTKLPRVCYLIGLNFPWYTACNTGEGKEITFNDLFIPKS